MVPEKKLEFFWVELLVATDFLIKILDGLILSNFPIQILDGQILKIVFLFWKIMKYERKFLN